MSLHFADMSKALIFKLTEPVMLQLGMVGSRSKINFGIMANMEIAGVMSNEYVNFVNTDHYDLLMGMPFMHQHRVILNFEWKCISINGSDISAEVIPAMKAHDTHQHHLRMSIEVLDGEDMVRTLNPLPMDSPALMITETEYLIEKNEVAVGVEMDTAPNITPVPGANMAQNIFPKLCKDVPNKSY
ncbi:hypothetical protein EDD18DRAFT_1360024 [Armillaria luteobubalina]|uniref:Uncharacterized protein n=1 Tax=Armillaria luteobubalina TaxID=153913 RepID=A0AA39PPY4_9AGAR|nr:hypothetical protein EDD18DRAFT_1360024 [Armillaria luteobubalina]